MNYPDKGLEVLVLNPNTNNWEFAYYLDGQWWQGVANDPNDILINFVPLKWKYRNE